MYSIDHGFICLFLFCFVCGYKDVSFLVSLFIYLFFFCRKHAQPQTEQFYSGGRVSSRATGPGVHAKQVTKLWEDSHVMR